MSVERISQSSWVNKLHNLHSELKKDGILTPDTVVDSLPDINNEMLIDGRKVVCFCSSGYLGVQNRPEVKDAAAKAVIEHGVDTTMSRFVGGNLELLVNLERDLADFKGTEDSIIFATGLLANVGAIPALTDVFRYSENFHKTGREVETPVIIGDAFNHYSIRMGIRISHANEFRYPHNDMKELARLLEENKNKPIIVITDGVFSLDGDFAPLPELIKLTRAYGATLHIDDAHGTGVYGANGRGSAEHFGLEGQVEIQMGTLSKAFGIIGGFVAADREIVDLLKFASPSYIFTSSMTAAEAAAVREAIRIVRSEPQLRASLWKNVYHTLNGLRNTGLMFPLQWSPIVPVMIGDERKTIEMEKWMLERGVYCSAVRPPGVRAEESRFRLLINANHSISQLDHMLNVFNDAALEFNVPRNIHSDVEWDSFLGNTPLYIKDFLKTGNV